MRTSGLGYIGIDSTDPGQWQSLASDVLGLMPAATGPLGPGSEAPAGTLLYKMDERTWRLAIHESPRDGIAYAGWELTDQTALAAAVEELRGAGIEVEIGGPSDCEARGVRGLARFRDPIGTRMELFYGAMIGEPFRSPAGVSGFLTGQLGMGHILMSVPSSEEAAEFYQRVLGLKVTDIIAMGPKNSGIFMRATPRHHSLAVMDVFPDHGLHHLMIEAHTLEDVGKAYDRAQAAGVPIAVTLGQHINDLMISFYLVTPGGFAVEFGCQGRLIDDETWTVAQFGGHGDLWGHHGPAMDAILESGPDAG